MSLKQIIAVIYQILLLRSVFEEYKLKMSMKNVNNGKASARRNSKALAEMSSRLRKMEEINLAQAKELETCYEMVNQQRQSHESSMNSISQKVNLCFICKIIHHLCF